MYKWLMLCVLHFYFLILYKGNGGKVYLFYGFLFVYQSYMKQKLEYDPEFDFLTPQELLLLNELSVSIQDFVKKTPELNMIRYATRDAHATTYHILKGKCIINENFEEHLVFPKKNLDAVARISSAHMKIVKGKWLPAYGFSLKLEDRGKTVANFPLVNFPLFPFNNVAGFLKMFTALNRFFSGNTTQKMKNIFQVFIHLSGIFPEIFHPSFLKNALNLFIHRSDSILSFPYHSIGAYRLGNHLVKIKLVPKNIPLTKQIPDVESSIDQYLEEYQNFEAELFVQYAFDLKNQPVNELHREWKFSEFLPIGKLVFSQTIDKNSMPQELLSFNPFENIDALKPVGRIQQLRNQAYQISLETRTKINSSI